MTQLAQDNANDCSKVFGFDQILLLSERDNFAGSYTFLEEVVRCSSTTR
jgi:hypothetical protein